MTTSGNRRVVVTGIGILCSLGMDAEQCWMALREGRSGIAPITSVDITGLRFQNGAEVLNFRPEQHFEPTRCDLMDRFAQFAVIAARQAVKAAQWKLPVSEPHSV